MTQSRLASPTPSSLATALRAVISLRSFVISALLVGTSSSARAAEPAETPTDPTQASDEAEAPPTGSEPADPALTEAEAPAAAPTDPAEANNEGEPSPEESSEASKAPEPAGPPRPKHDYDTPDLERRERHPAVPAPADASAENVLRARVGAVLFGVGLTSAVVAPVVVLRPHTPIQVEQGEGNGIALATRAAPLIAGGIISVVGGVSGGLGGRILSDLGGDPSRAGARRRGLAVASGLAIGAATGLLAAGVVDLARGGVLWKDVLARPLDADDAADGEEAASRLSRGVALLTMVPPMAGLGLGLSLGHDARARVVPSPTGVAVAGRF